MLTHKLFRWKSLSLLGLFLLSFTMLKAGDQINFDFSFSINNCNEVNFTITQGTPTAQQWDFGDGDVSVAANPTHFYGTVGSYNVCLTASDGSGTFQVCKTVDILAADCCTSIGMAVSETNACCFELAIDNPIDQFFTGVRIIAGGPTQMQIGYAFDGSQWGLAGTPSPTSVEFGYIGGTHIPVMTNLPVFEFCLNGATSGPETITVEWLIGPDVICTTEQDIECELCIPNASTFSAAYEAKVNPNVDYGYDEWGFDLVVDKNTDDLFIAGLTAFMDEIGSNRNLIFQQLDDCGYFKDVSQITGPLNTGLYRIRNVKIIDVTSQNLGCDPVTNKYMAFMTIERGGFDWITAYSILDENGCTTYNLEILPSSTGFQHELNDVIMVDDAIYLTGTRKDYNSPPFYWDAFVCKIQFGPDPCGPGGMGLFAPVFYTLEVTGSDRTTGEAITYDQATDRLYITGAANTGGISNGEFYVSAITTGLVHDQTTLLNANVGSDTQESGKAAFVDSNGDLVIAGETLEDPTPSSNYFIHLLKFNLPLTGTFSDLLLNQMYNIPGGGEKVFSALEDNNGDYLLAGDAFIPTFNQNGIPGPERPFLMKLTSGGDVIWTKTYQEAHHLEGLESSIDGYAMVGSKVKQGETGPFASTTSDIWTAKTNGKGELADCDCFSSEEPELLFPFPSISSPGGSITNIFDVPLTSGFECVPLDSIRTNCGPACGSGGPPPPPCPTGCCSAISGYKFEDTNCDGIKDPFEPNLCGWTIELRDANTGALVASTVTNSAGFYSFGQLCPGDYTVSEVQQTCWTQSFPAGGAHTINLGSTTYLFDLDFGNCLALDCDMDIATGIINNTQTPECENGFYMNNSLCLGLDRVCIETTNGVTFGTNTAAPGFQLSLLYPPTATRICIEAAGGGNIPVGNAQHLLDFTLENICSSAQTPQQIEVDYYLDLPCSFDKLACSETINAECPVNCPTICDGVSADYSQNPDGNCCFDIMVSNTQPDLFTQLNIKTIGGVDIANDVILDPSQWAYMGSSSSQLSLISLTGNNCPNNGLLYLPTGNYTPVTLCLENYTSSPQQLEIEWVTCDDIVCADTLTFECAAGCVDIVSDTFYCENNIYKYEFDFLSLWDKNINQATISYIDPSGATFTPDTIDFNPGISPGGTGSGTFCLDNLGNATDVKLEIQFLESDCCWCFSDTLCLEVPECPCQDCEDIVYTPQFIGNDSLCCWSLDIENPCLDSMQSIELALLDGVSFHTQQAGSGWYFQNFPSLATSRWQPLPPGTFVPTGSITNKIEFCIDDYSSPPVIPQVMEVRWIDQQDNVVCQDSIFFDCEPGPPDTCLVIVNDTLICLPDGTWQLDWSVENRSTHTANYVYVNSLYSLPGGATFNPGVGNNIPVTIPPASPPVPMPSIQISNANAGDLVCIQASIYDNQTSPLPPFGNWCCNGDTLCLTLPPCPPDTSIAGCCDSLFIYGDSFENKPDRIKHLNGFTYLASNKVVGGDVFALFSKFAGDGTLIWEQQFDDFSQILDFVETAQGEFLLVGRTMPLLNPGWQNNRSVLAKLDANGAEMFIEEYDNNGREGFIRIVEHPNPQNVGCPYYVLAIENQDNTQNSATDEVHLYNMDDAGNICFSEEYTYRNDVGSDDQWVRLLPLQNGNLLILGDQGVTRLGVISEVSGLDGSIVNTLESDLQMRFWDAIEINPGLIAVAGAYFNFDGSLDGAIWLIDPINWSVYDGIHYDNLALGLIRELDIDANGDLFATAQRPNDLPIILKYAVTGNTISEIGTTYFDSGETAFSSPNIYTDPSVNRLYYTDARKDHPESYGDFDILFGSFDLQLTDTCLQPIVLPSIQTPFTLTNVLATTDPYVLPLSFNNIDLVPPGYSNMYVCPDSIGGCCQDSLDFVDAVDNGFIITASGNMVTIDNPLLNDCAEVGIAWGDGDFDQVFATALPITHTYNSTGVQSICIFVTEVNDDGTLCWEREYCQDTEPLPVTECVPCEDPLIWETVEQNGSLAPRDMVTYNGDLIVCGNLTTIQSVPLGQVARYDGTTWIDVPPSGFTGDFDELLVHQGKLWAIVGVRVAGVVTHYDLALWDGGTNDWILQNLIFDLPTFSTYGRLYSMYSHANGIILGGEFEEVGPAALSANNVVLWDNLTNTFMPFGGGVSGAVRAITEFNGNITIGGAFLTPQLQVAWWNGSSWQGFASGINNYTTNPNTSGVLDFEEVNGELLVLGRFPEALNNGSSPVAGTKSIVLWNSTSSSWSDLGGGLTSTNIYHQIDEAKLIGSRIYLAGFFGSIGSQSIIGIAIWDGATYQDPGLSTGLAAYTIECFADQNNNCELWVGAEQTIGRLECSSSTSDALDEDPSNIRIYPNPVNSLLLIESLEADFIQEVMIYDITGREIRRKPNLKTLDTNLDMANMPDGVYLIQVRLENGYIHTQRIIKQ
ncbi:MAG: T9SS type A sorting domain-containing protein [Bacteroidetes bacterium]|nr:T9SS type A sorting domain-containing protein [Bacteroidota bacterium]